MSTELIAVQNAVAEMNRVESGLHALREKYAGVVYEVTTTIGMDAAKAARLAIREPRYEVERVRKAAKAPILALGKKLDMEAARITAELEQIEAPIDAQIKGEEARKEAEKQARIAAEQKRVADLQERVADLRGNPMLSAASGSALIAQHIADLESVPVDASFEEFEQQARDAKDAGLKRLADLHAAALAHEAEQARLKAEREELAKLRAEQAERERIAQAERERLEAIAKAERDAESERLRNERAENERIAAERRAELDAQEAQARATREAEEARMAAERAEIARQQEALRKANESKPKPRKAPSGREIVELVAETYQVTPRVALGWLLKIDWTQEKTA
jgi:hypothetical protein